MLFVPICNKLERQGISRSISAFLGLLLFITAVALVIVILSWQLSSFSENLQGIKERSLGMLEHFRNWLNETVGISQQQQDSLIDEQSKSAGGSTTNILAGFALGTLNVLINTVLVLVYTYLFLFYRSRIKTFILKLVPAQHNSQAKEIIQQSTNVSQQYLGGLTGMILMLWVLYGIGFSIVGVENALFFAILCGILEIIPFVGNITGTSFTVLAVVAQGGQSQMIIGVIAVYLLIQFFQTYILEPLIVGNQVNINPLFTIMALVVGESIWGIAGMVLAIPLLGIIKIICDHVPSLKAYGYLIGTEKRSKNKWIDKIKQIVK